MAGMFDMMKKAQDMQRQMKAMQDELVKTRYSAAAGGGLVNVEISGEHLVQKVSIAKAALEDAETLEDLVKVAINEAIKAANVEAEKKMKAITGGLKIPGLS